MQRKPFVIILLRMIGVVALLLAFNFRLVYLVQAGPRATPSCRVYVDALGPPGGDGTSWGMAYKDLQEGINAANVARGGYENTCDVWVAAGTYSPASSGSYFIWSDFVNLIGSFSGTESDPSERDWQAHPSILEGNGYRVITTSFVYHATLDGFIITGGDAGTGMGGGIYISCGAPLLTNLVISGNSANYGGGVYVASYGCPYPGYYPRLINVIFSNNSASYGGGMANMGSNTSLTNVVFFSNGATQQGSGIYNAQSSPGLINVSMDANGIHNYNHSSPTIDNSIVWGPTFGIVNEEGTSVPTVSYSLVEGCNPGGVWNTACGTDGTHNLADVDPKFTYDLHLQGSSPAIDKGDNTLISLEGITTDLDGNPRIVGSAVDLGAYEYQSTQLHIYIPLVVR